MQRCRAESAFDRQSGFTLIEIMLVIVMIATVSAMIVPSFFSISGRSVGDEARRLQLVAGMAVEEVQLTGVSMRLLFFQHGYRFERLDAEHEWIQLSASPFQPCELTDEFKISFDDPSGVTVSDDGNKEKGLLGQLQLFPDGLISSARVTLASEDESVDLYFAPGPRSVSFGSDE